MQFASCHGDTIARFAAGCALQTLPLLACCMPALQVARSYVADTLNKALGVSSYSQSNVIAVSAMEAIGLSSTLMMHYLYCTPQMTLLLFLITVHSAGKPGESLKWHAFVWKQDVTFKVHDVAAVPMERYSSLIMSSRRDRRLPCNVITLFNAVHVCVLGITSFLVGHLCTAILPFVLLQWPWSSTMA
jgi:hypothetical protein